MIFLSDCAVMKNNNKPLRVVLHGMDARTTKTMMLFLQGPCRGEAIVVINGEDADADIFDGDKPASKSLIEQHLRENILRPVIVLSLQDFVQEGILHVKKPVSTNDMLLVLDQAKRLIGDLSKKTVEMEMLFEPQAVEGNVLQEIDDWFNSRLTES